MNLPTRSVLVLALALLAGCASGRSQVASSAAVGALAVPQPPAPGGFAPPSIPTNALPPFSQYVVLKPCNQALQFAGVLRHLSSPPNTVDPPTCFLVGPAIHELPDTKSPEPWAVGIIYPPNGMSLDSNNFLQLVEAGGIYIDIRFGERPQILPATSSPNAPGGGYALVTVNGHRGVVTRLSDKRVWAVWDETINGRLAQVTVLGNYSPDQIYADSNRLADGAP